MHDCGSGNNHFTQLKHWRCCLWKPLNLPLLFIWSSSSTGAHESAGGHTRPQAEVDTLLSHTHTHTETQGHKVSAGASALWFLLSKGCKMEIRLNGWHGLSLPAACNIESCSNTSESDCDRLILARCSKPLTFFAGPVNPPDLLLFYHLSVTDCASQGHNVPHRFIFSSYSSHRTIIRISCSHFFFSPPSISHLRSLLVTNIVFLPVDVACVRRGTW